jgi:hypothetical protein
MQKGYGSKFLYLILAVTLGVLVSALVTSNTSYGQSTGPQKLPDVKITSPTRGQNVPVGLLTISGESTDNVASNCQVSVKLNGIKPYQPSAPTGAKGAIDYSTWKFTLTPKYAVIKEGANKITSKITCRDISATLTKFYSVNVTGIGNPQTAGNGSASLAVPSNQTKSTTDSPAPLSPLSSSSYKGDSNANNNDNGHHSSHSNGDKHHHGSRSDNHKQHHHEGSKDSRGSGSDNDEEDNWE